MAIEAVTAVAAKAAAAEGAKQAAIEAARQIAEKVVGSAGENIRAAEVSKQSELARLQVRQMENFSIGEITGDEIFERAALKQKEIEAADSIKAKVENYEITTL
jgi:hypothetical protein